MTRKLGDVARLGAMISQIWPTSREADGATLAAIGTVLAMDIFRAFQTVDVPYAQERRAIADLLSGTGYPLTYCVARILNEANLNLSDLDTMKRQSSYQRVIACLDDAREIGARSVSLISGPRPAESGQRAVALEALEDSLAHICAAARQSPSLTIVIEPLDVSSHKRNTLGYTQEAVTLCEHLSIQGLELRLNMDTAHAVLNGEDPVRVLHLTRNYTSELHFCNCVTDPGHRLYGDQHIPFGPPGWLDVPEMSRLMRAALDMRFFTSETSPDHRPIVLCEVKRQPNQDPVELLRSEYATLEQAWQHASARPRT